MTLIEKLPKRLETTYPICGTVRACYSIVQRRNLFSLVSRETIFFSFFFRSDRSRSPIISHLITSHFYPSSSLSILSPVFSLWRTKMHCFSSFLSFFFSRARRKARLAEKRKERREENTFHPFDTIAARLNKKKKKKKRRKKERKRALLSRRYSINSNDAQAHLITQ